MAESEIERVNKELRRERRIFVGGPVVVFRWRAAEGWPVEYVSPNIIQFGYHPYDLLSGKIPYASIVHGEDLASVASEVEEYSRSGAPSFEQEYRIYTADGEVKWLYDFTIVERDADGKITHYVGYVLDITNRKTAEEKSRKLEAKAMQTQKLESLGLLAGGIAHDFNNLLVGILGNADLALAELSNVSPVRESVREIENAAVRASDLCRQLLAYAGKGKFVIEPFNLNEVVEEMTHLLDVSKSRNVIIRYAFTLDLPSIEGDITQVRQVIMNLITNASEAISPKTGVITISTGVMECDLAYLREMARDEILPEGRYVFLEISDTGVGMDEETKKRIFDPFFSAKSSGRGLGLAAALGIVRGHKGALKVYSEPGKGTTFKALFPAVDKEARPLAKAGVKYDFAGSGLILLVDDDEGVRNVGRRQLVKLGFEALTAASGDEALKIYAQRHGEISLVMLDLAMPGMDGVETYREMRRINPSAKVMLTSGYNEQESINRFTGKGLAGFIQKPYRLADLAARIKEVLEK